MKEFESILWEKRKFDPPKEFMEQAYIQSLEEYQALYQESVEDPEKFWDKVAREELEWFQPWSKVLEWKVPFAKWFLDGKLNATVNCIDRHLEGPRKNKAAIIWEGEDGESRALTFWDLYREVNRVANFLKSKGIQKGDTVAIYMPMVPELAIAMLACARIGAPHSIIFGGFSAQAISDRVHDAKAKAIITADGGFRRGKIIPLKANVNEALKGCPTVEFTLVLKRTGQEVEMQEGRDFWWHNEIPSQAIHCDPEKMDSEDTLFTLYTSGTTGKPKGVLHTTGGYMVYTTLTSKWIFDLKDSDTYWCTADIGWITGHSYIIYGILSNGVTTLMYEGAPNHPHPGRFWEIVEKHKVTVFYTAPTAIRAFMKWGTEWPKKYDLTSLRLLGTVGEPINPEAWIWYYKNIGGEKCPIVDTWWQTETGGILISPLPGAIPQKPGSATLPFMGIVPEIVDEDGNPVPEGKGGYLTIKQPWPSMLRTIWGDDKRYKEVYWSRFPGRYFTGDGAKKDEDGYYWIMGRVDDVINVSGHRLGTMEVESALVSHPKVAEAAVVGVPHEIKGEGICAFVTLEEGYDPIPELKEELRNHVAKEIGAIAKPDTIRFTQALPKTRSGKIMRRLLRDIASGKEQVGDTTTLEDYSVLAKLREEEE
ncbi:MAG: acetate--CoA ligase [Planctomycetota bacterium]|nr:MAG: acetate--CoA ligase [Planctomycetota bacterium]